ncbi:hypothetical protein PMAC_002551 [Pneumocystis sp. 'macacae']|nr:hypothetical protein PMAC_002551 [Pneumocystis sp. 'macacae']
MCWIRVMDRYSRFYAIRVRVKWMNVILDFEGPFLKSKKREKSLKKRDKEIRVFIEIKEKRKKRKKKERN